MTVKTIDLSNIQPDFSEDLLKVDFDYNEDRQIHGHLLAHYTEQRDISDIQFDKWLDETNARLIQEVDGFIDGSIGKNKDALFQDVYSNLIHPAAIILGMHASDHAPTLNMVESHIMATHKSIKIARIGPGMFKKANLLNIVDQVRGVKHLVVMIEQTETVELFLLETLVHALYALLHEGATDRVMALFCMSGSWSAVGNLLPLGVMNRMSKMTTIVKDCEDIIKKRLQIRLMENENTIFKMGPNLVDLMYDSFVNIDASVMNLRYLYQYSMFEHHSKFVSLLTLNRKNLARILKSEPRMIDTIRQLRSLDNYEDFKAIKWSNAVAVANFCAEQIEHIFDYHKFVLKQIYYYFTLLRDETGHGFPRDLSYIYEELMKNDDLGQSSSFVDAISKLSSYPVGRILKRIESITKDYIEPPQDIKDDKNVYSILVNYKEKLDNNDDCKKIVGRLVNKLLKHAQVMKNPLKMPLSEAIYYKDIHRVRAIPSTRHDALHAYTDGSTHFGILCSLIHKSSEESSANDLFNDFVQAVNEVRQKAQRKPTTLSRGLKIKTKVTRSSRSCTLKIDKTQSIGEHNKDEEEDEGLLKAIFSDLIDCMQHQGLVKWDMRRSKKGILRKCVWL